MKTKQCTLMALAALLFAACGNQNEPPVPAEKTAKLEITLAGTPAAVKPEGAAMAAVRSTGDAILTEEEVKIERVAVGVFNSDNKVNVIREFTTEEVTAKKANVLCSPATGASVIVVANAPSGHFAGVTTKAAFTAKTVDLSATVTGTSQLGNKLPMSGENTGVNLTGGNTVTSTVTISRLVGRVSIGSIQTAFDQNGQYKAATFKLSKIFLHNANITSTVAPGAPVGTSPQSGQTDDTYAYLRNDIAPVQSITGTPYTTLYWFYTFANDGSSAPTRLVLYGDFDPDGTTGSAPAVPVYYPITINKTQTGTIIAGGTGTATGEVKANATYTLTATIKGKGSSGPDVELIPATLDLTVSVATWALNITQDVTFN